MEYYLILARSVTYAQRMQSALNRIGIRSQIFRAPRDLTDLGCAYLVRISPQRSGGGTADAAASGAWSAAYLFAAGRGLSGGEPVIYLDSAATTFQKPPTVARAMTEALGHHELAGAGRTSTAPCGRQIRRFSCRSELAALFNMKESGTGGIHYKRNARAEYCHQEPRSAAAGGW